MKFEMKDKNFKLIQTNDIAPISVSYDKYIEIEYSIS